MCISAPLSSEAVAFSLRRGKQRLCYGKLATREKRERPWSLSAAPLPPGHLGIKDLADCEGDLVPGEQTDFVVVFH